MSGRCLNALRVPAVRSRIFDRTIPIRNVLSICQGMRFFTLVTHYLHERTCAVKAPSPGAPSSTNHHEFRESWLRAATNELRPYFASAGYSIPENIRFAIGFTSTGRKGNRQSESWHASSSADSTYEIFIRPDIAEPIKVLSKLVKELVHTTLPDGSGHGQLFRNAALKIGLLPPMRNAEPAPHLIQRLDELKTLLGPLPHEKLDIGANPLTEVNPTKPVSTKSVPLNGQKEQKSRMFKATCAASNCDFLVRVTAQKVREIGPPHCPKHGAMLVHLPAEECAEINGREADRIRPQVPNGIDPAPYTVQRDQQPDRNDGQETGKIEAHLAHEPETTTQSIRHPT